MIDEVPRGIIAAAQDEALTGGVNRMFKFAAPIETMDTSVFTQHQVSTVRLTPGYGTLTYDPPPKQLAAFSTSLLLDFYRAGVGGRRYVR